MQSAVLLTAAQYCCSWASLTDQLVRKFKESLGINMTMKKFFIFVPVQTMKIFFIFVVSSGHANLVRIPTSNIFFLIFRLMRYAYVFFFSLSGVLFRAVAKARCTLLEYGQSKVKGRNESQTNTAEAE